MATTHITDNNLPTEFDDDLSVVDDFPEDGWPDEHILDESGRPIVVVLPDLHGSEEERRRDREAYDADRSW